MPSSRGCGRGRLFRWLKRHAGAVQTVATLVGVFIGIGLGLLLKSILSEPWSPREVMYIKFVGDMHIRFVQALILPIIVSSMISAVGSLDVRMSRGLCVRTLIYYLGTTTFAAAFATLVVVWVRPGAIDDGGGAASISGCVPHNVTARGSSNLDSVLDIVRNLFPPNLVGAALEGTVTQVTNPGDGTPFEDWKLQIVMKPGSNLLGIIFLALIYGLTLGSMGPAGKPIVNFFTALMDASMRIMEVLIWFFPVTTCLLLAGQLVQEETAIGSLFKTLGWYTLAQVGSQMVHSFVFLPLLYWVVVRKNPWSFVRNLGPVIATAFGTNSSSATLPVTMECVQGACGIDERIAKFVLPIGATVNMDGTAIYRVIVISYLAQLCGRALLFSELLNIGLMAAVTSIGVAGLPGGAMAILALLAALGYPVEHYTLVLPVTWFVGRFSTVTNVLGDAIGAAIIYQLSREELKSSVTTVTEVPASNSSSESQLKTCTP